MTQHVTLHNRFRSEAMREETGAHGEMAISQHLSAELLSSYLLGVTAPGVALAVEAHIGLCEQCRCEAGLEQQPSPTQDALGGKARAHASILNDLPAARLGSAALGRVATGPWRRVARGVKHSRLRGVGGLGESVHLLSADPGAPLRLPAAAQLLVVLRGAVGAGDALHPRGDFIDTAGVRLKEANSGGVGCLCLIVGDDDLYQRPTIGLFRRFRPDVSGSDR
jgi:anti-sigma factor ChrR (cupin superfamily)